jgi:flagellar hook-length control protein FliK
MALVITTASSGTLSGVAPAEQSGSETAAASTRAGGDAFAGVLAGIGAPGNQDGRHAPAHDRAGDGKADPADSRSEAARPVELAGADLAMLAMLGPALPASTIALISSGCTAAGQIATAESGAAAVPPAGADLAAIGPAEQAAAPAQQSAAARPAQAVAAQTAAAVATAARLADAGKASGPEVAVTGPGAGTGPAEETGPGAARRTTAGTVPATGVTPAHGDGPVNALGPSQAADPAKLAASAPIFELARATQPPEAADPVTGTPSTPAGPPTSDPSVPATVVVPAGALQVTGPPAPAVVALPGTMPATTKPATTKPATTKPATTKPVEATAVTGALLANSTAAGSPAGILPGTHTLHHRPARGPATPGGQPAIAGEKAAEAAPISTGVPAEPVPVAVTAQGGNPAAPAGDPSVPAAQAPAAQPVAAGRSTSLGSEPAHRHPAAELPLARQVAGPVLALRAGGDGSHQLIVALHPAELGPVNVHVRIEGNLMTIALASTSETAHDALRDALPQLRSELQSAGLSSASVSVDLTSGGSAGSGAFANPRQGAGEPSRPAGAVPAADPMPAAPRHRSTGGRSSTYSSAGLDRWL